MENRWWEYYAVRYFVGTVVGAVIVAFLNLVDIEGQNPIKSECLAVHFSGSWFSHIVATQFPVSIATPIRQLLHGGMQGYGLDIVRQRICLNPRINHPFLDRLDVVAGTVKAALDFGRGAALDFYRPMLAVGPSQ